MLGNSSPNGRKIQVSEILSFTQIEYDWINKSGGYPLVNVYIAMERSTIFYGKIHYFYGHGFNSYVKLPEGSYSMRGIVPKDAGQFSWLYTESRKLSAETLTNHPQMWGLTQQT